VGWFYTHETAAFGLKVERHLHKRKKAAHQTQHTQTNTHTHTREIETTVHTEEERREREREREREKERKKERKGLGKQCCKEKTKAPCFRQQNPHMTHSLQTHPTMQVSLSDHQWMNKMDECHSIPFHPSIHPSIHSFIHSFIHLP
jgi:hypothetical protein